MPQDRYQLPKDTTAAIAPTQSTYEPKYFQDLRKSHLYGRVLELLNQVVREHPMLELINRSAALVR
ncbi:hypothetical protein H6F90_12460, partial [Trichocoleus sp. FACHB-591]|uniref:hypothetical protein n=1 Tax=Trichocoleus sp. FACHB-591 TaxID=2692872 RepID=UPI0016884B3C